MKALALALLALARPGAAPDHVGRIHSYPRSNSDGSEAERVHVYRASRTRIEVVKMRTRCRNAAFVTAELDLARGEATRLVGGRLPPVAGHEEFGLLVYDGAARRIDAVVTPPQGEFRDRVAVPDRPWHLYDYDLASLTVTAQYRADRRADFSFGLPLVLVGADMSDFLTYPGRADARFVRAERFRGLPGRSARLAEPRVDAIHDDLVARARQAH
ncbi:MAG: hypothetical protein QOD42_1975 [Sphingomonadales bacterium]|nr:hypothetical protein [Sphingomonadales bacterium]